MHLALQSPHVHGFKTTLCNCLTCVCQMQALYNITGLGSNVSVTDSRVQAQVTQAYRTALGNSNPASITLLSLDSSGSPSGSHWDITHFWHATLLKHSPMLYWRIVSATLMLSQAIALLSPDASSILLLFKPVAIAQTCSLLQDICSICRHLLRTSAFSYKCMTAFFGHPVRCQAFILLSK